MNKFIMGALCALTLYPVTGQAQEISYGSKGLRSNTHAPIGVMGDHMHKKGEWMVSYRYMRMNMQDNYIDDSETSATTIATTVPNPLGGPATFRVVPTEMTTDMHMVGAMYSPHDRVTLMAMANYIDREMDHLTFAGGAGAATLGTFTTKSKGFGDTRVSALIGLIDTPTHKLHLNAGLSIPTGSITETDQVLAPTGATPVLRMPYSMQLGSGTFDALPGITYYGVTDKWGWGSQLSGTVRFHDNSEDYRWGNKAMLSSWGSYNFKPWVSASARLTGEIEGKIDGQDSAIAAPVQTADPDNYGGERVSLSFGLNTVVPSGVFKGHRFAAEVTVPVYQNLNGPQLGRDNIITLGWQKSF